MPKINTYADMSIKLLRATENPAELVGIAMDITMKQLNDVSKRRITAESGQYILDAEHTSLVEHVHYTFLVRGISRSFLAQITRQRTAHPTSGSQHYQNYSDYPCAVHPNFKAMYPGDNFTELENSLSTSVHTYNKHIEAGVPKEEARQVLPNAATVNYLWTIDARNLVYFLRQRCCNRNVTEMRIFANRVLSLVQTHFPELFNHVGPQCFMDAHFSKDGNGCRQGKMQCQNAFWRIIR